MSYLARLHELKGEKPLGEALPKPTKPGFGSIGSYPDRAISGNTGRPALAPSGWTAALASLDASRPLGGIAPERWRILLADARWLARNHGETAAAFGWSASDLFGLDPARDGWGGLADRLEGARRVALTATVAHWRGEDGEGWLWRRTLTTKPLIWEVQL